MNNFEPQKKLHVVFLPCTGHGHMIPMLHIAKLFAAYNNVKVTIITTPRNVAFFNESIVKLEAPIINIELLGSSPPQVSQPQSEEAEMLEQVQGSLMISKPLETEQLIQLQLEQYLEDNHPDCLVADKFYPWTMASAAKFNIPRLVFHGFSSFALCAMEIRLHKPYKNVTSDTETFVLPALPHEIQFTRLQIPEALPTKGETLETEYNKSMKEMMRESDLESYGVIVNTFYELEPEYANFFKKQLGIRRTWNIGPVSLRIRNTEKKKSQSRNQASINEHYCLQWLASKKPNSVVYLCFGSTTHFIAPQLHEIAVALESSEQEFVWVVRNNGDEKSEEWLPTGFEERIENKGIILTDWAPQVLILEHEAIGAFVTHCGWNSTIEGISAGVPMVTWPVFAEQFYNEKLVTQILNTGVSVGVKKWSKFPSTEEMVTRDLIEKALREIMAGSEANERRARAKKLKEIAEKAVEESGSSHSDLSALINELRNLQL